MPKYKVSFIIEQGKQGWSEQWYLDSASPKLASRFAPGAISMFLNPRGNSTQLRCIRATDVLTPRTSFLTPYNQVVATNLGTGKYNADNASTAVLGTALHNSGRTRAVMLRGLQDLQITRDDSGNWVRNPYLLGSLAPYLQFILDYGLQSRFLDQDLTAHPKRQIIGLAPNADNANMTTVTYSGATLVGAKRVVFLGLDRNLFTGFKGALPILNVGGATFDVPIGWRQPANIYRPQFAFCRDVAYVYDRVSDITWTDLRTKKVGRASSVARGRRPAIKYRSR